MSRSHIARFALIALIFIGIQMCVALIGWAALKAINATRSYATGESLYSKGQKSAVLSLFKYADSGHEIDYDAFLASIGVPLGDRFAREALDGRNVDFEAAASGLRQSLTNKDDIPSVIVVFVLLHNWGPFAKAVDDWQQGDSLIAELIVSGERFHALHKIGTLTPDNRRQFLATIDALNTKLDALEYGFSEDLGDAARKAMQLVSISLAVCSVILWIAGLWLAWLTYRRGVERDIQLRESERRFKDFAETASDWFWQTDPELKISYVSERFAEALKTGPKGLLGKTFAEMGLEFFGAAVQTELANLAALRPFRDVGLRYSSRTNHEQYWMISGLPVFRDNGSFIGYRGTGRNITEEMHAKHALEEAKTQSELANRAKSEFLATMSHELRTPLNAIIGFSEIIKDGLFGAAMERYTDYAADIFMSGKHLLDIINDILDVSKIEAGQMELYEENVDVSRVIESVVKLLRQKIDIANVSLIVEEDGLPLIRADERKLKQIMMNLLSNAIKFTPEGGNIAILTSFDPQGDVIIEVRDTGIGMASDDIPKALAAFGQVDSRIARKHEGTGLGLPLVKALVEIHGGRFALSSELGRGTRAVVVLPKARVSRLAA
jgi:signal transduction histidine kinase